MGTIWEIVNSDLVEYNTTYFASGYEIGLEGIDLPHDVSEIITHTLNAIEYNTAAEALISGHNKGINVFLQRRVGVGV